MSVALDEGGHPFALSADLRFSGLRRRQHLLDQLATKLVLQPPGQRPGEIEMLVGREAKTEP